ncbi:tetratricopeptide repeat protein [Hyphococcus sp.]|uniref:tetratricopeptide repeat protein n=1 Tax=Hyphococcus sp. TaxID=2038636 RepID=UPI00208150B2|nr:MAG: hypothetical protein DHS20C04_00550 [Marinicaulis sp.]
MGAEWLGTAILFIAAATAGQRDESVVRTVIENGNPQFQECYQNARDGGSTYDLLKPCDLALSQEKLTRRKTAIIHVNRGVIRYNLGEYVPAIEDFSAALDLGIHVRAKVLVNRGLSFEALKDDPQAARDYEAALAFNPDNITAKRRLEELQKPIYERSRTPSRINAGDAIGPAVGI